MGRSGSLPVTRADRPGAAASVVSVTSLPVGVSTATYRSALSSEALKLRRALRGSTEVADEMVTVMGMSANGRGEWNETGGELRALGACLQGVAAWLPCTSAACAAPFCPGTPLHAPLRSLVATGTVPGE